MFLAFYSSIYTRELGYSSIIIFLSTYQNFNSSSPTYISEGIVNQSLVANHTYFPISADDLSMLGK